MSEIFPNILWYVDDDEAELYLMKKHLQRHHPLCTLTCFEESDEVIAAMQNLFTQSSPRFPDLILVDLNMPKMSGPELLHQLQQQCQQNSAALAASLVLTCALPLDLPKLPASCLGFAVKPDSPQEMLQLISTQFKKVPFLTVTAGIICNPQGHVLLCRRGPSQSQAGLWEFPGGKLEHGEREPECLARELKEELGMDCQIGPCLGQTIYTYPKAAIRLVFYEAYWQGGNIQATEHDSIAWVTPSEIMQYSLSPADKPFAQQLIGGFSALSDKTKSDKS